ncbi:MAG: hypothetical protein ACI3YC_04940 [Alloprevotella sp.]
MRKANEDNEKEMKARKRIGRQSEKDNEKMEVNRGNGDNRKRTGNRGSADNGKRAETEKMATTKKEVKHRIND